MMELMQLEMFIAVVEECSVRRAAERVYRTQPAVSIALRKLQQEIGTQLLEDSRRTNRRLTKAGEILYKYASKIISTRNEALSHLRGEGLRWSGNLCIGVDSEENLRLISHLGASFNRQHPGVHIASYRGRVEKLMLHLRDRKIDFVLLSTWYENLDVGSTLAVSSIGGLRQDRARWLIQRRTYQSDAVKMFSELLNRPFVRRESPEQSSRPEQSCVPS